jgi:DNA polymerase-3 subunit beta
MKVTIRTEHLRMALRKANMTPINRTLPNLSHARFDFADGRGSVVTTDMEKAIMVNLDATFTEPLSFTLPKSTVKTFLTGEDGSVEISLKPNSRLVSLRRPGLGEVALNSLDLKDFPPIPKMDNPQWSSLDAKWFCRMIGIALPAVCKEFSRPNLSGIAFREGQMASADGFRLVAIKSEKLNMGLGEKKVIIPGQTCELIRKLFTTVETLEVAFSTAPQKDDIDMVLFRSGDVSLLSQVIQGTFPQYEKLIPQEYNSRVSFSAPLMVQRLNMIDQLRSGTTRFDFHRTEAQEDVCSISARAGEEYAYNLQLPVRIESPEGGRMAFNIEYIRDALKYFSLCNLELTSPSTPGKFTGDIEGLTIVVMPMFVQW